MQKTSSPGRSLIYTAIIQLGAYLWIHLLTKDSNALLAGLEGIVPLGLLFALPVLYGIVWVLTVGMFQARGAFNSIMHGIYAVSIAASIITVISVLDQQQYFNWHRYFN